MGCFTVPVATALVTTAVKKSLKKGTGKNPFIARLGWLQSMMLGGGFLLAIEHIYHGEVIFTPPFLSAVRDGNVAEMLHEIATVGVAMTGLVIVAWVALVSIASILEKNSQRRTAKQRA